MREDADAPVRVLLADDRTMFRGDLAGVVASYGAMEVVADVPDDGEALRLARGLAPDAVVASRSLAVRSRRPIRPTHHGEAPTSPPPATGRRAC